jgi:predicted nicotinamide N-methyase
MDTDFILALAKAAVAQPEPEPESEPEREVRAEDHAMRIRLSLLSREVVCHQDKAIGIGGVSWQASLALSHAMDDGAQLFASWSGLRVLELGCGTGLCGLTAWRLGAQAVLLTDMAHCESLVQRSIAATSEVGTPPCGTVKYAKLRWGGPVPEEAAVEFDVVLGSDLTYNCEDHEPLLSTLQQVCRHGQSCTQVVLAHQSRPLSAVVRACATKRPLDLTSRIIH